MRKIPWFVLVLLASAHSTVWASGIFLIGQARHVQSSAFVTATEDFDSDSQSFSAPDEGDFDATALANAEITGAIAAGTGSQISTIDAQAVHATGTLENSAQVTAPDATGYASGASNVALRFMVQNTTTYRLVGFVEAFGEGFASVQFSRPFLTVVFESATEEHIDLDLSGQIEPGTYDFNVTCSGALNVVFGQEGQSTAGYDLALVFGDATGAPVVPASIGAFPNPSRKRPGSCWATASSVCA